MDRFQGATRNAASHVLGLRQVKLASRPLPGGVSLGGMIHTNGLGRWFHWRSGRSTNPYPMTLAGATSLSIRSRNPASSAYRPTSNSSSLVTSARTACRTRSGVAAASRLAQQPPVTALAGAGGLPVEVELHRTDDEGGQRRRCGGCQLGTQPSPGEQADGVLLPGQRVGAELLRPRQDRHQSGVPKQVRAESGGRTMPLGPPSPGQPAEPSLPR